MTLLGQPVLWCMHKYIQHVYMHVHCTCASTKLNQESSTFIWKILYRHDWSAISSFATNNCLTVEYGFFPQKLYFWHAAHLLNVLQYDHDDGHQINWIHNASHFDSNTFHLRQNYRSLPWKHVKKKKYFISRPLSITCTIKLKLCIHLRCWNIYM